MTKRNKHGAGLLPGLLPVLAAAAVLPLFFAALGELDAGRKAEELHRLDRVLRRGCAAFYAEEGVYPPDLAALEERYAIRIDDQRFSVFYTVPAENLMPDITVLERLP